MSKEAAAQVMEHLCNHDWHGYSQYSRWGDGEGVCAVDTVDGTLYVEQGDRDCSSADIDSCKTAGLPVGAATYTGNMRQCFTATGAWEWHDMSYTAHRGDIYLNEACHTAMCVSDEPDMLAEFSIAETGGIDGEEGDQLQQWGQQGESHICGYYNYPWDGILHYVGADVVRGSEARGVQIYHSNGTDAQRWAIEHNDDGTVSLRNIACGKYLDVMGGIGKSGQPVQVYPGNGTDAQRFLIVEKSGGYAPDFDRPQAIIPKINSNLRLDVCGGGDREGTGIQVYDLNDTPAQQWYVMDSGDGTVTLINNSLGAKMALDVVGGGK